METKNEATKEKAKVKAKIISYMGKYSLLIILIVLAFIPIMVGLLMNTSFFDGISGSNDGWLGFWGGYLGSIAAILGVYWQMHEENKQWKEDINRERKEKYVAARPFVTMDVNYDHITDTMSTAYFTDKYVKERKLGLFNKDWKTYILRICNLSSSNIYSVRIQIEFHNGRSEFVYINQIKGGKEYQVIANNIDLVFQNRSQEGYKYLPISINMYFYTSKRERAINVFKNTTIPNKKYFDSHPLTDMLRVGYPICNEVYELDNPQAFKQEIQTPMFSKDFVESTKADNR